MAYQATEMHGFAGTRCLAELTPGGDFNQNLLSEASALGTMVPVRYPGHQRVRIAHRQDASAPLLVEVAAGDNVSPRTG
jgi:hypothetical protein